MAQHLDPVYGIRLDDLKLPVTELTARNHYAQPNSMEPTQAQDLPLGSIRVEEYGPEVAERYVDVLRLVSVESLLLAEHPERIQETPEYKQYVVWAKEGREAPLIQVNENHKGQLVSANRRRALAAKEAGLKTIRAWVSPINKLTGDPLKFGELLAS